MVWTRTFVLKGIMPSNENFYRNKMNKGLWIKLVSGQNLGHCLANWLQHMVSLQYHSKLCRPSLHIPLCRQYSLLGLSSSACFLSLTGEWRSFFFLLQVTVVFLTLWRRLNSSSLVVRLNATDPSLWRWGRVCAWERGCAWCLCQRAMLLDCNLLHHFFWACAVLYV